VAYNAYGSNPFNGGMEDSGYDPNVGASNSGKGIYDGGAGMPMPPLPSSPPLYWSHRNQYAANPNDPWSQWRQPTDQTLREHFTKNPQEGYQLFTNAFGSPDGNLQKFMQSQFGQAWADYVRQTGEEQKNNLNYQFTDTLDGGMAAKLQNQWANQTPYQRGENYGTMSAGRRV